MIPGFADVVCNESESAAFSPYLISRNFVVKVFFIVVFIFGSIREINLAKWSRSILMESHVVPGRPFSYAIALTTSCAVPTRFFVSLTYLLIRAAT